MSNSAMKNSHAKPEVDLKEQIEISVILPSRDEEETIGVCIDKIRKVFDSNNIVGEIIVADSSRDDTPNIAGKMGAKVVTPDKMGYGYAYKFGFKHARGKFLVIGDADDTYDFLEMLNLVEPLKKGEADLVIGSRLKGKIEKGSMPLHHRWIGNPVLTWFLNLFFRAGVSDAHSGFRAIRKDALERLDLNADGMEFASEMIIEAVEKGLRIKEIPISYYKRINENSKLSSFSDGWRHLKFMLLLVPNYLFIYPGFFLLLIGLFLIGSGFLSINIGYNPGTYSVIAGSLFAISGYQILFFGLFTKISRGRRIPRFLTLEGGIAIGALLFITGSIYASYLLLEWMGTGFEGLQPVKLVMLGFTLIVLGIQTFFSSFMLSIIADKKR